MSRCAFLSISICFVCLLFGCSTDRGKSSPSAKAYPRRAMVIICPWSAGGGTDSVSRFFATALQRELGQPCNVVNRTGGSGAVGHSAGALAKPDGYTLTMITFELSTMHHMGISELTYKDFQCLLQMNGDPAAILVQKDAPWQSLEEFLEHIAATQADASQKVRMSGTATGGAWDLARAGLLMAHGLPVNAVVWVPKDGSAPSLVELLGGHLDAVCCSVPEAAPQLESGELRALTVMSDERLEGYPDIPTAKEAGVDWVAVGWRGLALPRGTPPEIVSVLQQKCMEIAHSEEFLKFMSKFQFNTTVRGPEEFTQFLAEQDEQWKPIIEAAGYAR